MIRRAAVFSLLLLIAAPAAAQDAPDVLRIPVALQAPDIALSPDGATLAAYENSIIVGNEVTPENLPIYLFDTAQGVGIGTLEGVQTDLTRSAAFSPDGTKLASYHLNGQLVIWDVASRTALQSFDWLPFGGGVIEFSGPGSLVILMNNGLIGQQIQFDLTAGSITGILTLHVATYAEFQEIARSVLNMGSYGVAAQEVGPDGQLYGATFDGEVFVWDTESGERVMRYPPNERPQMLGVRNIEVLPDNSLVFYDNTAKNTVVLTPDGRRTDFAFGGQTFALSDAGLLYYGSRDDNRIFSADLTAAAPAPQAIGLDLGEDIALTPASILALQPDGDLVLGGFLGPAAAGVIFVIDIP